MGHGEESRILTDQEGFDGAELHEIDHVGDVEDSVVGVSGGW